VATANGVEKNAPMKKKPTINDLVTIAHAAGMAVSIELEPLAEPLSKIYHKAAKLNRKTGQASALCYRRPRAIPDSERWTMLDNAVTCPKCLSALKSVR
jgi:hypothetical protein